MSAPRVPEGWTQEAADLVWEDWQFALEGSSSMLMPNSFPFDGLNGREAAGDFLHEAGLLRRQPSPYGPRSVYRWVTTNVRLRAWAAVGAPVLAPAEDGRPSLAEWVAACEGSALGRPAWDGWVALFKRPGRHRVDAMISDVGHMLAHVTDWGCENDWPASRCDTPAELRALLDTLARPA